MQMLRPSRARRCLAVLITVALACTPRVLAAPPRLGAGLPPGTPTRPTLDAWERIDGDVETGAHHVVYELYVEPTRDGLYAVTRYQMALLPAAGTTGATHLFSEKYVWNVGRGQKLRCFALEAGVWRALAPNTDEYRAEMATAMAVYALHRRATLKR